VGSRLSPGGKTKEKGKEKSEKKVKNRFFRTEWWNGHFLIRLLKSD